MKGPAVGAGAALALAADLRVADPTASLVPGYMRIGVSSDGGLSALLTRFVGPSRATSLFLRNRTLDAGELLAHGIVDAVVADRPVEDAARELAAEVAHVSPLALKRLRRLIDIASTHDLDAHLDAEEEAVLGIFPTADFREGVTAFLEHRAPTFTGR
jgi:2-(1,2-epoxy-1,2-dihydrophenyl)acetyl-CoA isomerase